MKGTLPTHIFTSMIAHEEKNSPTLIISHDSSFHLSATTNPCTNTSRPRSPHARGVRFKPSYHGPLWAIFSNCVLEGCRTEDPRYQAFLSLSMLWNVSCSEKCWVTDVDGHKGKGPCTCGLLGWWYKAWQRRTMWPGYFQANNTLDAPPCFIHYCCHFFTGLVICSREGSQAKRLAFQRWPYKGTRRIKLSESMIQYKKNY